MSGNRFLITGSDTGVGKTVFSAGLAGALNAYYWKPVQAGLDEETDAMSVLRLSGLSSDRILPEAYRLNTPCSPHQAAEIDGVRIELSSLAAPVVEGPLVIEGAGGVLTPLDLATPYADVFKRWNAKAVVVASLRLGAINHTLLSLEALRARDVEVLGVVFSGDANAKTEEAITVMGKARHLGRLPLLEPLDAQSLRLAVQNSIDLEAFQ